MKHLSNQEQIERVEASSAGRYFAACRFQLNEKAYQLQYTCVYRLLKTLCNAGIRKIKVVMWNCVKKTRSLKEIGATSQEPIRR